MYILFYILCVFLILGISRRTIRKASFYFLKKDIENKPLIGKKDLDGTYIYKKRGYALRYRIKELPWGAKKIEWIYYKRRLTIFEEFTSKIKRFFEKFILYPHFNPFLILSFSLIIIVICIWILIPLSSKIRFYKFALSHLTGVSAEQIEYKGGGWFEVSGERIIPQDNRIEPFTFTVNPLRWLFFSDRGYVTRWRGKGSGYKTHYLEKDKEGKIFTEETGREIHAGDVKLPYIKGKVEDGKIKWGASEGAGPQGAGHTQDIEIKEGEMYIIDHIDR